MKEDEERNCACASLFFSLGHLIWFDTVLPLPVTWSVLLVCQIDGFTRD